MQLFNSRSIDPGGTGMPKGRADSFLVLEDEAQGPVVRIHCVKWAGLPLWRVQWIENLAKIDYSQALKYNRIFPARF